MCVNGGMHVCVSVCGHELFCLESVFHTSVYPPVCRFMHVFHCMGDGLYRIRKPFYYYFVSYQIKEFNQKPQWPRKFKNTIHTKNILVFRVEFGLTGKLNFSVK